MIAADLLGRSPDEVELHGWEIYGGKGSWNGVRGRLQVLNAIFDALKRFGIQVYWSGLPVDKLKVVTQDTWKRVLVQYLDLFDKRLRSNLPDIRVEVYGDVNEWVKDQITIEHDDWQSFEARRACFCDSKKIHGLQLADVVSHTIYRSNKAKKSNTDIQANKYRAYISSQFIHLPSVGV